MRIFSVSFNITKEDYRKFYNIVNKSMNPQRLKLLAIMLTVSCVLGVMNLYSLAVSAFFLLFIFFFLGDVVNHFYIMKNNEKSLIAKRKTTIDFYSDHFEILYLPDEMFKGKSERHYPLSSVKMVLENREYFYFKLEDLTTVIMPKRDIDNEAYSKIKNMIDNLYPDKFLEE